MQAKEELERIKSLLLDEKGHAEAEKNHYALKTYERGFFEGKQFLCNNLLREIEQELREVDSCSLGKS